MRKLCDACHHYEAHYVVRIEDKTYCFYCYSAKPTPFDGIIHQTTDHTILVMQ
jgi:hypothetical protein